MRSPGHNWVTEMLAVISCNEGRRVGESHNFTIYKKPAWKGWIVTCATATSDKVSHLNTQDRQPPWKQIPCLLGRERAGTAKCLSSFFLLFIGNKEEIFPARSLMPKYSSPDPQKEGMHNAWAAWPPTTGLSVYRLHKQQSTGNCRLCGTRLRRSGNTKTNSSNRRDSEKSSSVLTGSAMQ